MSSRPPAGPSGTRPNATLELAELFTHTARRLRRGSIAQLAPLGLTYAQARVLRLVGQAGRPLRMADLATQLDVVPRSVTTMIDALETAGLASRQAAPDDRRSVLVSLTPAGRRLLDGLEDARRGSAEEVFGGLAGPERTQLLALLGALCARGSCPSCCDHTGSHGSHEHTGPRHSGHAHREPGPTARRGGAA